GLTVVVAWPHGYVSFPGPVRRGARLLWDNLILIVPPLALIGLFSLYRRRGRDPAGRGSVVVRYEPPPGVTPAELGAIVDETVNLRDITATVVDLAVRGHLVIRIEEEGALLGLIQRDVTVFERLPSPPDDDLLPHEKLLLDGLFEGRRRVSQDDLENEFYQHLPGIRSALYERLTSQRYFAANPQKLRKLFAFGGVLAGGLTLLGGFVFARLRGGIMPQGLVVPGIAGALTAAIVLAFSRAMPRKTARGVELAEWARGFEEFVERVESERLEQDRARNVFESLLPYAMALGVAPAWARRFEGLYAHKGAARPAWFTGRDPSEGFSTRSFQTSLDAAMTRAGEGMTAAPRSSGSSGAGGGGSSGGGGGGGGGGSW
ncbi:MAG: DUF2207 domain-containing protein, partial [Acidobacteriota bacterium]|nr:DUF2207 domain-containing protein [Acidobacteriota bacterium]